MPASCSRRNRDSHSLPPLPSAVGGEWIASAEHTDVIDPMNGAPMLSVPATSRPDELAAFVAASRRCPKTGLHNPFKNVARYVMLGKVSARAATTLRDPVVADFFARLIQRVAPKSYAQAMGEVTVTAAFLENFSGDNVRYLARSFGVTGDHDGARACSSGGSRGLPSRACARNKRSAAHPRRRRRGSCPTAQAKCQTGTASPLAPSPSSAPLTFPLRLVRAVLWKGYGDRVR